MVVLKEERGEQMIFYEHSRSENQNYLYFSRSENMKFRPHLQHSFEFFYVESGQMDIMIDGRSFSVVAGQAVLILPGQIHSFNGTTRFGFRMAIFSCDFVYDFYSCIRGKESENPIFPLEDIGPLLLLEKQDDNRFLIKSALYSLVGQFLAYCPLREKDMEYTEPLERTIAYVQEHFSEPLSLKELAATLGYHYNYLSSYLNSKLGIHFSTLVNSYRIDRACELLEHSDMTVTGVAEQCGFETIRSFNRSFKELRGCTPNQYRINFERMNQIHGESF